jgi:hypothetical protein
VAADSGSEAFGAASMLAAALADSPEGVARFAEVFAAGPGVGAAADDLASGFCAPQQQLDASVVSELYGIEKGAQGHLGANTKMSAISDY